MRQNSTDYSGERAPRRPCVIAQAGYTGKNYYAVAYRNQSIQESLRSGDPIVRMFAILDRRAGKGMLREIQKNIGDQPEWLRPFCLLRLNAEKMGE